MDDVTGKINLYINCPCLLESEHDIITRDATGFSWAKFENFQSDYVTLSMMLSS